MGVKERREREKDELRTRILDAARELFAEHGYDAVTMRKVAERIEYSPTAIYLHFPDKEALLRELCAADFLKLAQEFQKIAQVKDPIERVRRVGQVYVRFAVTHPNHYKLMFMTAQPGMKDERLLERGNPEEDAYEFLRASVADAIAAKRFRPELKDADLLTQLLWAGVHGVVSLRIARESDPWVEWRPLETTAELMIDALTAGLTVEKGKR